MRNNGLMKKQKLRDSVMETAVKQTFQQYMVDMFIISLNDPDVMGKDVLGYKRLKKVLDAVQRNYDTYYDSMTKNPEADYFRWKIDEIMKRIMPLDVYLTFEKRYEWLPKIIYKG